MTELTPEDIVAARKEGDLVATLLAAAGIHPKAPRQRTAEPEPEPDIVHIAHPGAWPTGTNRPAPVPPASGPQIDAALADYRHWLVADRPAAGTHCPCLGCTPGGMP
ncbi:hypothetical protein ACFY7Y_14390 [Streptomyces virginiae]|uniref:hypothetical protein n=1 Tax=Streptomyces virginiae TaxID=1961 RepID=UPI0036AEF507